MARTPAENPRTLSRSWGSLKLISYTILLLLSIYTSHLVYEKLTNASSTPPTTTSKFDWHNRQQQNPITSFHPLPTSESTVKIPRIQFPFSAINPDSPTVKENAARQQAVKQAFIHSWKSYQDQALHKDIPYNNWYPTLVSALPTLYLMNLTSDFTTALTAVSLIDFSRSDFEEVKSFESTASVLGGLLSAFDISGHAHPILLQKAVELGDFLYGAFDTSNRMPVSRWYWERTQKNQSQEAYDDMLLAEINSLAVEFTRLTQLTNDPRFFDATQRVTDLLERKQDESQLPGMWPLTIDATGEGNVGLGNAFTLGWMADSTFKYLTKEYLQLNGHSSQTRRMYEKFIDVATRHNFFRPMTIDNRDILLSALTHVISPGRTEIDPQVQHLACYVGGMVAVGSKIFERPDDLDVARKLVDGCIWAHEFIPSGLMAEAMYVVACAGRGDCEWNESRWHEGVMSREWELKEEDVVEKIKELGLQPGITDVSDGRFLLRPEAIESIFVHYRITGDEELRDAAWTIFAAIETHTRTQDGYLALRSVVNTTEKGTNSVEYYWTGSTLKYFYLLFGDPSVMSLDEFVFTNEGHPFKRPI